MKQLTRDSLPLGGFAGLTEHRLVTDSRVFGARKSPLTAEGLGNFVYLADAQFNPHGETGMHPHKEIDVISVMVKGRVSHEGSLEHGKSLEQGDVQVQRAGGEGFAHNEVNPDVDKNRMLQLWVLPEEPGQKAGYQHFSPQTGQTTRIYGGEDSQTQTFASRTTLDLVHLEKGTVLELKDEVIVYVFDGQALITEAHDTVEDTVEDAIEAQDGHLVRGRHLSVTTDQGASLIVVGYRN